MKLGPPRVSVCALEELKRILAEVELDQSSTVGKSRLKEDANAESSPQAETGSTASTVSEPDPSLDSRSQVRTTAVELLAQLLLKATGFSLADEGEEGERDEAL